MKHFFKILKRTLPWGVALLIFVYLFRQYPPDQVWQAVKYANIPLFLSIAVVYFVILYLVDCYSIARVLARFGYPVDVGEIFPARGVTYLIMNINYPASQAAFAYYLKRTHKVPIFEVLSVFFFIAVVDLYILITLALIGSFFQDSVIRGVDIGRYIQVVVLVAYVIFVVQLTFWRSWFSKLAGIKKEIRLIRWIRSKKIFTVFNDATVLDYLKTALIRLPIHVTIIFGLYLAIQAFDAYVPFVNVMGAIPIAFLIGTIPITPSGLGTTNVAIVELLSPHISGSVVAKGVVSAAGLVFALTIVWMFVNYSLKALIGVVWLQKVSKKLFRPTGSADPQETASEAAQQVGDI